MESLEIRTEREKKMRHNTVKSRAKSVSRFSGHSAGYAEVIFCWCCCVFYSLYDGNVNSNDIVWYYTQIYNHSPHRMHNNGETI